VSPWVRHGAVVTPELTSGLLDSITRATVVQLLTERLRLPVVGVARVDRTELYLATRSFSDGHRWEILPILAVTGASGDGRMGPVTPRRRPWLPDLVRGLDGQWAGWRTPCGS